MTAAVEPCDDVRQAGRSTQAEYARRYAAWRASRVPASLYWLPPVLLVAVLGGWYLAATTGIGVLGVVLAVLILGAAVDVLYRPPHTLRDLREVAAGERATARLLARTQCDGYAVLHDRKTVRDQVEVEHLLVGPGGMLLLDSKNWANTKPQVRVHKGELWIGRESQTDLLARLRREAADLAAELGGTLNADTVPGDLPITPVVVVHNKQMAGSPRVLGGVAVVESNQLLRYLSRLDPVWDRDQVQRLASAAERVLRIKDSRQDSRQEA